MNRLKALYRGWGIPCAGTQVYVPRYREEWLNKIPQAGVRRRAELLYQQLDGLQALRREVRGEFLAESRKHKAAKLLRQIPCIGPIRTARLIALMQTPHRFRSKRQLWTYGGLGIETHDSAQYRYVGGQLQRSKKPQQLRGLNRTRPRIRNVAGSCSGLDHTNNCFKPRSHRRIPGQEIQELLSP
jgi:transposase